MIIRLKASKNNVFGLAIQREYYIKYIVNQNRFISQKLDQKMRIITTSAILVIFLAALPRIWGLGVDLEGTEILGSKDQFRIRLRPQGLGPFTISYTRKPADWIATQKYLLVPKVGSKIYNQVLISVVIRDQTKAEFNLSLVFILNSQHMVMDTNIYPYNAELDLSPITVPIETFQSQLLRVIKEILIRSGSNDNNILNFGDVFQQILVLKDLQQALSTNNIVVILKAVSKIPTANLNCIQQVAYLSEVSTLAYRTLNQKESQQDQDEKDFIKNYANKVGTANDQTDTVNLRSQDKQLISKYESDVIDLKSSYMVKTEELKNSYIQFNQKSSMLEENKKALILNSIKLDSYVKDLDSIWLKIGQINFQIPSLSNADKIVKNKAVQLLKQSVEILNGNIEKVKGLIKGQEAAIKKIQFQIDEAKLSSKMLQTDINSLQERISRIYIQLLSLYQPLQGDQSFLIFIKNGYYLNLRSKAEAASLIEGRRDIALLYDIINYIDKVLDNMYFSCYGVKNARASLSSTLPAYEIAYSDFLDYVRKFYQNNTKDKAIFANNSVTKIELQRVSILESIWSKNFGDVIYEAGSQVAKVKGKSACDIPSDLQSWTGVIASITHNVVQVRGENAMIFYVLLGACSRIEVAGKIPHVGSLILWRGRAVDVQVYDCYYALVM